MEQQHLLDIASYNTVTDWRAVANDGIVGTSVKVSQALNYLNPLRGVQTFGARAVGVVPGGYHFGDPRVSATEQARYFITHARALGLLDAGALAPMYDAEDWVGGGLSWSSPDQLTHHIREFIRVLRDEADVNRVLVYGSLNWWVSGWLRPNEWQHDGVEVLNWIAYYNGDPGNTGTWHDARDALHQHTSDGVVPGVIGRVDKNVTLNGRTVGDLRIGDDDMGAQELAMLQEILDNVRPVRIEIAKKTDGVETPTALVPPNVAAANVYAMTFYGSNYGWGDSIIERLTEIAGGDKEELRAALRDVVTEENTKFLESFKQDALAIVGSDNEAQALAIVDALARRLALPTPVDLPAAPAGE